MQQKGASSAAENIQIDAITGSAHSMNSARYQYCVNSGIWMNRGMSMEQFCKSYAFHPESMASVNAPGQKNVSRSMASSVNSKGMAPVTSQQPFAQNPAGVKKAMMGRVQRR